MSHKHKVTLEKLFSDPIASSLDWKKIICCPRTLPSRNKAIQLK